MARGVNKVILVGNLGGEPDVRVSQAGSSVTKFSVATSESWRDKQTDQQQERTEWHNVVCFARLGEIAGQYLHKGSKVYIEGSLRTNSWEGQDGQKRYRTEVIARELQMLDSRGQTDSDAMPASAGMMNRPPPDAQEASPTPPPEPQKAVAETAPDATDDIPF